MLRIIAFTLVVGLAVVWVEPRWDAAQRELTLRLRDSDDIARLGRGPAAGFFERNDLARSPRTVAEVLDALGDRLYLPGRRGEGSTS